MTKHNQPHGANSTKKPVISCGGPGGSSALIAASRSDLREHYRRINAEIDRR